MEYKEKTYEELVRESDRLEKRYSDIESDCLKDNLTYNEFCAKAHDVKEQLYFIDKYIRLKKEPLLTYGKDWVGDFMTIEDFRSKCATGSFIDEDGYGYYATETAKSDILIYPSDVTENILREDFPYVIWLNR